MIAEDHSYVIGCLLWLVGLMMHCCQKKMAFNKVIITLSVDWLLLPVAVRIGEAGDCDARTRFDIHVVASWHAVFSDIYKSTALAAIALRSISPLCSSFLAPGSFFPLDAFNFHPYSFTFTAPLLIHSSFVVVGCSRPLSRLLTTSSSSSASSSFIRSIKHNIENLGY